MRTIDQLIDEVIAREGDYSDHAADRGGPTRYGVTEQVARANGYAGNMRVFPRASAVAIYRTRYWTAPRFDQVADVAPAIAAELFDAGVNMGPVRAATFLQRLLNVLNQGATTYPDMPADGQLGPLSIAALKTLVAKRGAEGVAVILFVLRALRAVRYVEIAEKDPSQEAFEYGWLARQVRAA